MGSFNVALRLGRLDRRHAHLARVVGRRRRDRPRSRAIRLDGRGGLARPVRRVLALAGDDVCGARPTDAERGR